MKRGMMVLSAAALALAFAMAGSVMAQEPTHAAVANADYAFFDAHPNLARRLAKDPTLIDNQQFVDSHPALRTYLHDHPNARHEFKDHPYNFMHREDVYEAHHN
jgi:hypothetical protein